MDMHESEALAAELEPLLASVGLVLVDFSLSRHRGSSRARAVVYSPAGTGTAECSKAHRLIHPRLQVLLGDQEPYLEVTSPGIDRELRSAREWGIFAGRDVRVLLKEGGAWLRGRIASADGERAVLATPEGERSIEYSGIAKARLDSSREGE